MDSTYSDAHKILAILDEHDRRKSLPRKLQRSLYQRRHPHVRLFESIREEFSDIEAVREASTPSQMVGVLKDVSDDLLKGKYRPGTFAERRSNYYLCADARANLRARVAQFEAAA